MSVRTMPETVAAVAFSARRHAVAASRRMDRPALLRSVILVALGTALLTLSAKVNLPLPYVPMTLQTLVVLVIGAAYVIKTRSALPSCRHAADFGRRGCAFASADTIDFACLKDFGFVRRIGAGAAGPRLLKGVSVMAATIATDGTGACGKALVPGSLRSGPDRHRARRAGRLAVAGPCDQRLDQGARRRLHQADQDGDRADHLLHRGIRHRAYPGCQEGRPHRRQGAGLFRSRLHLRAGDRAYRRQCGQARRGLRRRAWRTRRPSPATPSRPRRRRASISSCISFPIPSSAPLRRAKSSRSCCFRSCSASR